MLIYSRYVHKTDKASKPKEVHSKLCTSISLGTSSTNKLNLVPTTLMTTTSSFSTLTFLLQLLLLATSDSATTRTTATTST